MEFIPGEIPGIVVVEPKVFQDERGFFLETYQEERYREGGVTARFAQDNHSRSTRGTVRGLHAQLSHPQAKLVRVIEGIPLPARHSTHTNERPVWRNHQGALARVLGTVPLAADHSGEPMRTRMSRCTG